MCWAGTRPHLLCHGLEAGQHVPEGEDAAPGGEEGGGLAPVVTAQPHLGAGELLVVLQLEPAVVINVTFVTKIQKYFLILVLIGHA